MAKTKEEIKEEIKSLNVRRGSEQSKITRAKTFFDNVKSDTTILSIQNRIEAVENAYSEIQTLQDQIQLLDASLYGDDDPKCQEIEDFYFSVKEKGQQLLLDVDENHETGRQNANPSATANARLPDVPLPTFDGSYDAWDIFAGRFTELVGNNPKLRKMPSLKLHYLKEAMVGEKAKDLISLDFMKTNDFDGAWKALKERFENKRVIIDKHLEAIMNAKPMFKETSIELKKLLDLYAKHIGALKSSGQEVVGLSEQMLVFLMSSRLDPETRKYWENCVKKGELPKYTEMTSKLWERVRILESIEAASNLHNSGTARSTESGRKVVKTFTSSENAACEMCKGAHNLFRCKTFRKLKPFEMAAKLKEWRLCFVCFKGGHSAKDCTAPFKCEKCKTPHNKLLHFEKKETEESEKPNQEEEKPKSTMGCWSSGSGSSMEVLLCTAVVLVKDYDGNLKLARVLLDSGSQSNFMTEKFARKLKLKKNSADVIVKGIDSSVSTVKSSVDMNLMSRNKRFEINLNCLVIEKITGKVPSKTLDRSELKVDDESLADPRFNIPANVDILLGAQHFHKLMKNDKKILNSELLLQDTVFGFVVAGSVKSTNSFCISLHTMKEENQLDNLNMTLQKFWEVENVVHPSVLTPEERYCEEQFAKTHRRHEDGRFIVQLPIKENCGALGESKQKAMKMLDSLEKKLQSNDELKHQYLNFMREYEVLGHMERVKDGEEVSAATKFYLPHHCVLKPSSTTTKVRVVFNASAESSSKLSLNDVLMVGPKIQQDLRQILLRFRKHRYVFVSDLEKMFRQIWVEESQRDLQRVICRLNEDKAQEFRLKTVTYGTAPASYLATKCVWQVAEDHKTTLPLASMRIQRDFYMDDLLSGADKIEDAIDLKKQMDKILTSAGFNLRKWSANAVEILEDIPISDREIVQQIDLEGDTSLKTLGIVWNPVTDKFCFSVKPFNNDSPITKRQVLSDIARFYDPFGFVEPVIVTFKMFMQSLWKLKMNWDERLPSEHETFWKKFRSELSEINNLKIDRHVLSHDAEEIETELIGFADASEKAFGACVYIRSKINDQRFVSNLLTSKTRVAPIKTVSLPRLELCAALLLSQLVETVILTMEINFKRVFLFTDSEIVLCWIKKTPSLFVTFVANRISEIQRLTQNYSWLHVETQLNSADIISRGITAMELIDNDMWWHGPSFLQENEANWPANKYNEKMVELPEKRRISTQALIVMDNDETNKILLKFDSYQKLKSVIGWIRRFINNALSKKRNKNRENNEFLTPVELVEAELLVVKCLQRMEFAQEFSELKKDKQVGKTSKLKFLNPFVQENIDVIRVGGRIKHSDLAYDVRNPLVLSAKHPLVKLLVRECHQKHGHAGQQTLLAILRQKYWIVGARNLLRKVCHECVLCFRVKPRQGEQFMGDLPKTRLNEVFPFFECGVDYAGPIYVKTGGKRSTQKVKAYIALFICFVTKAVHLELVSDATSECFIAALRRFAAEHGYPAHMHSDNGGNFVKANTDLIALKNLFESQQFKEDLNSYCRNRGIQWHFIPARAAHMGALWESHVKITKYHLIRMSAHLLLTFEQQLTLLKEIQAIVNSRPITTISCDANDPVALTPAHFLLGREATSIPEPSYINTKLNCLTIWEKIQQVKQMFWKRFHTEYITSLQQRLKWFTDKVKIEIGSLALIKDENVPPLQWKLGKIVKVYPGPDGIVRVVDLKTENSILKRSVHNICVFPQHDNNVE